MDPGLFDPDRSEAFDVQPLRLVRVVGVGDAAFSGLSQPAAPHAQ